MKIAYSFVYKDEDGLINYLIKSAKYFDIIEVTDLELSENVINKLKTFKEHIDVDYIFYFRSFSDLLKDESKLDKFFDVMESLDPYLIVFDYFRDDFPILINKIWYKLKLNIAVSFSMFDSFEKQLLEFSDLEDDIKYSVDLYTIINLKGFQNMYGIIKLLKSKIANLRIPCEIIKNSTSNKYIELFAKLLKEYNFLNKWVFTFYGKCNFKDVYNFRANLIQEAKKIFLTKL